MFKPTLVSRCKTQTLTKQQKSKIQTVEMKYLRGVKTITKIDRVCINNIKKNYRLVLSTTARKICS